MIKRKRKNLIISILALIITLLIFISAFEIYLGIQYQEEHEKLISKYEVLHKTRELCTTVSENLDLIYEQVPNKCRFNNHGFADYNYSYIKGNNVFRIVIIGDSVAAEQGVKLEESFGNVLEKKLNNISGKKYEVIILAVSGYSTSQELILLEEQAFNYNPDLIIWSYVLNDPGHPLYHEVNSELGRYFFKPKTHFSHYISKKLFLIKEKKKGKNCEREFHKFLHCVYRDEVKRNIKKIGDISTERDVPVIFLIHPVLIYQYYVGNYPFISIHNDLSSLADKEGLLTLDLFEVYKYYNLLLLRQEQRDPWHPNVEGYEIAADYIYNFLLQEKLSSL